MAELEPDGKGHPKPREHLPWTQPQERNPVGLGMDLHMESMVIHLHCWSCMHEPGTGTSCSQPKNHETQVQRKQGDRRERDNQSISKGCNCPHPQCWWA